MYSKLMRSKLTHSMYSGNYKYLSFKKNIEPLMKCTNSWPITMKKNFSKLNTQVVSAAAYNANYLSTSFVQNIYLITGQKIPIFHPTCSVWQI